MSRKSVAALGIGALLMVLGAGLIFYFVFFTTPRMRLQPSIRAFEALMPEAPAESVPLEQLDPLSGLASFAVPEWSPAARLQNIGRGAVYYGYYCLFCHGERGDGEGPVGQSYMPRPTDLRSARLGQLPDGELLRAMLLGTGHQPVLNRVVPPGAYAPLLLYVRVLAEKEPGLP